MTKRPKVGDRKTRADGTVVEWRQDYVRDGGQWCACVRGSRPVCSWVPVGTPWPWEER